jgi:adenylate cyclase class 2
LTSETEAVMLEVEMKFEAPDLAALAARLAELGATLADSRSDSDRYFNAPDRDFGKTDEAVRIRSIGPRNAVTYKGPKLDTATKTRTELEEALPEGRQAAEIAAALLIHLGFRPTAIVRKQRQVYQLDWKGRHVEVTLDHVQSVGEYVEIETLAPADQLHHAREAVQSLAQDLGMTRSERRSYLELLLEKAAARPIAGPV